MKQGRTSVPEEASNSSGSDSEDDTNSTSSADGSSVGQPSGIDEGDQHDASRSSSDNDSDGDSQKSSDVSESSDEESNEDQEIASSKIFPQDESDDSRVGPACEAASSDDECLPLHERVLRKERKGLALTSSRERKSSALKLATERLAVMRKQQAGRRGASDKSEISSKKRSKHAPTEVSSKRSDFFRRGAPRLNESGVGVEIGAHRYKPLDPRVSSLSGHLNEEQFEKNYEFLEEMRNKEIGVLRKRIAARRATGKRGQRMRGKLNLRGGSLEEDEEQLLTLKQERAEAERRRMERAAKQSVKRKIRDEVTEGKREAYFLKRKEKKELELEAKLEEVRKRKGNKAVEKLIAKRRRKAKSRDASKFAK